MNKHHQFLKGHCTALYRIADGGDPWVFLCASAMIEYLAKMTCGDGKMKNKYPEFIETFMAKADARYKEFRYKDSSKALPKEMYYVLRCGLVHSFTLKPNRQDKGTTNSILLSHKDPHFHHREDLDACVFNAYNFVADLCKVIDRIFQKARNDSALRENIKAYWKKYPPLGYV